MSNRFLGAPALRVQGYNASGSRWQVITGPPGAGKSTHVATHMRTGDFVWDYDHIMQAITRAPLYERPEGAHCVVMAMRKAFLGAVAEGGTDVWVIASAPTRRERAEFEELGAKVVVLAVAAEICLERIADRPHAQRLAEGVRSWWARYEP